MNPDLEKYRKYLKDDDLTEEQATQYLETLWHIMKCCVDLGFGLDPVQLAQKPCGKPEKNRSGPAVTAANEVECSLRSLISNFEASADPETDGEGEGVKT